MTGPRYETAAELQQRTGHTDTVVCTGCGAFVMDVAAHDRFHDDAYVREHGNDDLETGHTRDPEGDEAVHA
jgi:hypothetical protein